MRTCPTITICVWRTLLYFSLHVVQKLVYLKFVRLSKMRYQYDTLSLKQSCLDLVTLHNAECIMKQIELYFQLSIPITVFAAKTHLRFCIIDVHICIYACAIPYARKSYTISEHGFCSNRTWMHAREQSWRLRNNLSRFRGEGRVAVLPPWIPDQG